MDNHGLNFKKRKIWIIAGVEKVGFGGKLALKK